MRWFSDPGNLHRFHKYAGWAWMIVGIPVAWAITYLFPESRHAAFAILVVSLYANSVSHWGASGAARAEEAASGNDPSSD